MQVNENGLLSFLTEIPSYFNVQFPLDYPLIAALYSDVDARGAGAVWHRTTRDPTLLARAQTAGTAATRQPGTHSAVLVHGDGGGGRIGKRQDVESTGLWAAEALLGSRVQPRLQRLGSA